MLCCLVMCCKQAFVPLTAHPAVPSVRTVLEAQSLFWLLLQTAHPVGPVIHDTLTLNSKVVLQHFKCVAADPKGFVRIPYILSSWSLILDRHAQAAASAVVSDLQQWLLPDTLGPGKLWCLPRESLLPCEYCALYMHQGNMLSLCVCLVTEDILAESRCERHPVPQWCVLSGGQHCSWLLHGNLLS